MFIELSRLLSEGTTIALTISCLNPEPANDPHLCVTLTPIPGKSKASKKGEPEADDTATKLQALNAPISICGTASELDRDLPKALATYVVTRARGMVNLSALEQEISQATASAKQRLDDAQKKMAPRVQGKANAEPAPSVNAPGKHAKPAVL